MDKLSNNENTESQDRILLGKDLPALESVRHGLERITIRIAKVVQIEPTKIIRVIGIQDCSCS